MISHQLYFFSGSACFDFAILNYSEIPRAYMAGAFLFIIYIVPPGVIIFRYFDLFAMFIDDIHEYFITS